MSSSKDLKNIMEESVNLKKLVKLGIVQVVEPSENLMKSYMQKSEDSLKSAKILLDNKQFADSISLSYFSMYNSLLALMFFIGIKSENHKASIFLLKDIFGIDNETIKKAKLDRKDKQYYPNFLVSDKEVLEAVKSTELFNSEIAEFIARLNSADKEKYLNKARAILEAG